VPLAGFQPSLSEPRREPLTLSGRPSSRADQSSAAEVTCVLTRSLLLVIVFHHFNCSVGKGQGRRRWQRGSGGSSVVKIKDFVYVLGALVAISNFITNLAYQPPTANHQYFSLLTNLS
jgi:hypothetical protein